MPPFYCKFGRNTLNINLTKAGTPSPTGANFTAALQGGDSRGSPAAPSKKLTVPRPKKRPTQIQEHKK